MKIDRLDLLLLLLSAFCFLLSAIAKEIWPLAFTLLSFISSGCSIQFLGSGVYTRHTRTIFMLRGNSAYLTWNCKMQTRPYVHADSHCPSFPSKWGSTLTSRTQHRLYLYLLKEGLAARTNSHLPNTYSLQKRVTKNSFAIRFANAKTTKGSMHVFKFN